MNNEKRPPRKRGCLFYGCISTIVLSLVAVLIVYLASRYLIRLANELTDTKPFVIEPVEINRGALESLRQRLAAFQGALDGEKLSMELELSAEDINMLLAGDPRYKDLKNKLFVSIEQDRIRGKVSIPLDNFGPFQLKGRYLNGIAHFKVSLENGILLDSFEVKNRLLPARYLTRVRKRILSFDNQTNAETRQMIQKLESVQVTNGAIVLRNRIKQ